MKLFQFTLHDVWNLTKDLAMINLGMAIYAVGWAAFLLPYHITTGGLAGAAAILQFATGFPMQTTIFVINAILLVIAWWQLGLKFMLKSAFAVFALVFYLQLGQDMMMDDFGHLNQILDPGQDGMACIIGAVLNGVGIALIFLSGGCTGGWDIVAAVVNKYTDISLGRMMLFLDFFVVSSCLFIFKDWRMVVFGYVTLIIYTFTVDVILNSSRQDVQITIYSKKHQDIGDAIRAETGHTNTLIFGEGGYSHDQLKIEVVIVHKREVVKVLRMIRDLDPEAFVTQHRVEGVYGKGFGAIKG